MPNDYEKLQDKVTELEQRLDQFQSIAQLDPQIVRTIIEAIGTLKLSDLSDVENTDTTTTGYVLKKTSTTWQPAPDNTA